jgi:hypothetical protein
MTQNSRLAALLAQANEAAEIASIDMSQVSTGGQKRLLPPGCTLARLVEYIEFGKHAVEYQGKPKPPALQFRLGFALYTQGYCNDDGTPYILRTFDLSLGNNEKAKAKIAFDRMNYDGQAKHFAQMLGKAFLLEIKVVTSKATPPVQRNEIAFATISPPIEPVSKQYYQVPEATDDLFTLFLWDVPTKESWDSLFIEGTNDKGQSKNYLQALCLEATNFEGSPLQTLLAGAIPDITQTAAVQGVAAPAALAPVAGTAQNVSQAQLTQPVQTPGVLAPAPVASAVPFDGPYNTPVPQVAPAVQNVAIAAPGALASAPVIPTIPTLGPLPTIPQV